MTEILQIIVLACHIGCIHKKCVEESLSCEKKLIKCMDKKAGMREWYGKDLKECLLERK